MSEGRNGQTELADGPVNQVKPDQHNEQYRIESRSNRGDGVDGLEEDPLVRCNLNNRILNESLEGVLLVWMVRRFIEDGPIDQVQPDQYVESKTKRACAQCATTGSNC
jgi:hypothetical protein